MAALRDAPWWITVSRRDRETVRQTARRARPYDAVNHPIPLLFGADATAADAAMATAYCMSSINHDVG